MKSLLLIIKNHLKNIKKKFGKITHSIIRMLLYFIRWSVLAVSSTLTIRLIDVYLLSNTINISLNDFSKFYSSLKLTINSILDIKTIIVFSMSLGIYTISLTFLNQLKSAKSTPISRFSKTKNNYQFTENNDHYFEVMKIALTPKTETTKKIKPGETLEFEVTYRKHSSFFKALFIKKYVACYNPHLNTKDTSNVTSILLLLCIILCILIAFIVILYLVHSANLIVNIIVGLIIIICFFIAALTEGVEH